VRLTTRNGTSRSPGAAEGSNIFTSAADTSAPARVNDQRGWIRGAGM